MAQALAVPLAAALAAAGWALGGEWSGAIAAAAALAAAGWLFFGLRRAEAPAAESDAEVESADETETPSTRREPQTESERRADEDWRRVANGTAPPSPLEPSSGSAKRDADWLEM